MWVSWVILGISSWRMRGTNEVFLDDPVEELTSGIPESQIIKNDPDPLYEKTYPLLQAAPIYHSLSSA